MNENNKHTNDLSSKQPENKSDNFVKESMEEIPFQPRALVVDDEERIRDSCERMLEEDGFGVSCAKNGEEGLRIIEETHYDIVLLDLMMAGLSGFDVLARIKSLHPDSVVIVITGYATIEHSIEAMKKGAFDFLSKPFSPQDLRRVVRKAIEFIRTLQDIATEKSRMRVLVNLLTDGVMTTDNKKNVALANPVFLKMIRCTQTNVQGYKVEQVVDNPKLLDMIDQAVDQPADSFAEIAEEIVVDGDKESEEAILGAKCIPFRDRLGRKLGTVTVLNDITALKKLDQVKSDFVSMVAHEIKGPLNSVLMLLDNVKSGLAGDMNDKQTEILERVSDRIHSLTSLSAELLDLAKIESGLINQEKEELDLCELAAAQTELYQDKAAANNISLDFAGERTRVPVMGNLTNLEEVIANLVSNAISYTPENGRIRVSACLEGDYAVLKVSDTGYGIPPEEQDRIFQRFCRVKNEQTRFISGTGLGLAIVKSIVEAHEGLIQVDSKPGEGTVFRVYLPRSAG
ncbi:MAG: response regulator [Desulfobacteraceae bacterium]|nr:response regulator [Desulfobacteraceae bacterium]MCF8094705.1 response regulator [Desulfobacteraceae bacterium]